MHELTVKGTMVPVEDYASISVDASLLECIAALEQAQHREIQTDPNQHRDRAVLAINAQGNVVGKLSMWTIIGCLEPKFDHIEGAAASSRAASRVGSARNIIDSMMKSSHRWRKRLAVVAEKAGPMKVGDLVHAVREGELIDLEAPIEQAVHQFVAGHFMSLLVTEEQRIVGVLRLVDVYEIITGLIKGEASE